MQNACRVNIPHLEDAGSYRCHLEPSNPYSLIPFSLCDLITELLGLKDEVITGSAVMVVVVAYNRSLDFKSQVFQKIPL